MGEADNYGPLVPYDCSDEEEEEETPQHPLQQPCDCIGGRLSPGGVYLPYLRKKANMKSAFIDTDDQLLNWEPTHWRVFDDPDRLELYHIIVDAEECVESECLEMLRQIGCEKGFSCCSIEIPGIFFAWLKQEEAEKLKGVKGIANLVMRRKMFVPF